MRVGRAGCLRGEVVVPGDKSISHRAALLNAVADGQGLIRNYAPGADCSSSLSCLQQLGVRVTVLPDTGNTLSISVVGSGLAGLAEPDAVLDAGNSGTTTRLLCGLLAGQDFVTFLTGDDSLRSRPMLRVVEPLRSMGATILGRRGGDRLPLAIRGGRLHGAEINTPVASAQVKSSILLAGLLAQGPTSVTEPAASRDHTERMLQAQGVHIERTGLRATLHPPARLTPLDMSIPGDFSSAAYWLVLACVHPDAEIIVRQVGLNPGRIGLLEVLRKMGADIQVTNEKLEGGEPVGDVAARSSSLVGVDVGGGIVPAMIDEVPLLAVAAAFARGTTRIGDAAELRVKESDRLKTTAEGLLRLGARVTEQADGLEIEGGQALAEAEVSSYGDHRLAMSLAVAGMAGRGARVLGSGSVSVSYPGFWQQAASLGADIGD